jgi:Ni/Co efflux regulator RcnB
MKRILTALVLASFLGAGLACAQGTTATAVKSEPTKQVTKTVKQHKVVRKTHKKAVVKTVPETAPVAKTPAAK